MVFLIALGALIGIGAVIWVTRNRRTREGTMFDALGQTGPLSRRLGDLLTADCVQDELAPQDVASAVMESAIKNMQSVESYCAMMSMTSTEDGKELATWRHDVVLPDRFHARQAEHIENWLDEWIRMGDQEYTCTGFWVQSPDVADSHVDRSVNIAVLVNLLSKNEPTECRRCDMLGDDYLCFVFSPPYEFGIPPEKLLFGTEDHNRDGSFRVFVNTETFMVERALLTTKTLLGDDPIDVEIQISIAAFGENISVEMPVELLPVVDADGVPQIRMDVDPTVPFHAW